MYKAAEILTSSKIYKITDIQNTVHTISITSQTSLTT